jgi:hypothetical protein
VHVPSSRDRVAAQGARATLLPTSLDSKQRPD